MKIVYEDTFWESLEKVMNSYKWWKVAFWERKWDDFRRGRENLKAYKHTVKNLHPYNADSSVLALTKIALEQVLPYMTHEVDETRLSKINNIKRAIKLIDHYLKEDYPERCGWIPNEHVLEDYEPTPENIEAIEQSHKLAEEEWEELFTLLKDLRSWWD